MGGMGKILAWVAWVHKILACVVWVKILAWVAWVHKILVWVKKKRMLEWQRLKFWHRWHAFEVFLVLLNVSQNLQENTCAGVSI